MIPKTLDVIAKEDIDALVANAVVEGRTIEYKEQLPGGSDEDKREFLADASSFANAGGGDLLYGVREKRDANGKPTGIPEAAEGLASINADAEKRRLEDMLRNGIEPRIPGVRLKHIDGFAAGPVLVLRVPKSWASPHMVAFKNLSRFFSRTSAGKHQLDVHEIRAAFTASESLAKTISGFRSDRVGKVLSGETPRDLEPGPKFILHLLPVQSFSGATQVDLKAAHALANTEFVPMGRPSSWTPQFNFDGCLITSERGANPRCDSYIQLFRSGVIEAVCTRFSGEKALLAHLFEKELLESAARYFKCQRQLGLLPPVFLAVSVAGTKGFVVSFADNFAPGNLRCGTSIDREVLLTPECLIEDNDSNMSQLLRSAFDAIWQASGFRGSFGYDEQGKRIGLPAHGNW